MFQRLLISVAVVMAFALPATAEEKPGKSLLNLDLGGKKDGVGVKAKVDPKKKNPLDSLEIKIGSDKKSKEK
ncbi:MAG: hypothetical protein WAO08_10385 [Hyphomicrobiaceae bacterium]|jgi:hypothetical protein